MGSKLSYLLSRIFLFFRNCGAFEKIRVWRIGLSTLAIKASFQHFGRGSTVQPHCSIYGAGAISVGKGVHIRSGCWIQTYDKGEIRIGDKTLIGFRCKITARNKISIGKNVLFADNVYITDFDHVYKDTALPVRDQKWTDGEVVIIEDDVWLGQNAVIRPGVTIGRHSVVGSSAVVTKSIPPFSVVAGVPSRIIRKYDEANKIWIRILSDN